MMIATFASPARSKPSAEKQRLLAWILCWVVLPNAGFWLLWIVGVPPRLPEIVATTAGGLIVRNQPYPVKIVAFVMLLTYSILSFVAGLFNLAIVSLVASFQFLAEMNPVASYEYPICAIGVCATLVASFRLLRLPTDFTRLSSLIIAIAAMGAAVGMNGWVSFGMRGSYKRSAPAGASFGSAVRYSGFANGAADHRHLILVVVEAMGLPSDSAARARLLARWQRPDIASRYRVTTGTTPYFGSTTNGEIRELCGRWGDYPAVLDKTDPGCLPARLHAKGYATSAFHAFEGSFFDRSIWYPHVGFDRMAFGDTLMAEGAAPCEGVFPGACDRDIPPILYRRLKAAKGPQFLYWVTLNSHLPVPADASLKTLHCAKDELPVVREFAMICRQFKLWDEVADGLARQLVRPDFPTADVLLVGNHMPPYFDRSQRSKFDPERVPWILLHRR